ncbi:Qat anti-phage system associated protein QatB [Candidatus Hydrogenedentota bacterium]
MGTSASSTGPGSGVPFDPPWLDDIAPLQPGEEMPSDDVNQEGGEHEQPPQFATNPPEIAPPRRFYSARRALGTFVRTGEQESFKKSAGHYSRTGMGGARNVASRMRTSTMTGANLFGILQSARERTEPTINEWIASLTERDAGAEAVVDEIIRRAAPNGGSLDETTCRESMAQAMEDLLTEKPNVDLLNLGDDDIWALTESFLGYETFHRLFLDIGQVFENSSLSPRAVVARMNEMQDYLKAELCVQVEALREKTPKAGSSSLQSVLQRALKNTFLVYEGSL